MQRSIERRIDGLDTGMDGKCLAQNIEILDHAARDLGVRPLTEFFSMPPEIGADFLDGEGIDMEDMELPPLKQFGPQDGLATVRALTFHSAGQADGVAQDLRDCERILSVAAQNGVCWHLEGDF